MKDIEFYNLIYLNYLRPYYVRQANGYVIEAFS